MFQQLQTNMNDTTNNTTEKQIRMELEFLNLCKATKWAQNQKHSGFSKVIEIPIITMLR